MEMGLFGVVKTRSLILAAKASSWIWAYLHAALHLELHFSKAPALAKRKCIAVPSIAALAKLKFITVPSTAESNQ